MIEIVLRTIVKFIIIFELKNIWLDIEYPLFVILVATFFVEHSNHRRIFQATPVKLGFFRYMMFNKRHIAYFIVIYSHKNQIIIEKIKGKIKVEFTIPNM